MQATINFAVETPLELPIAEVHLELQVAGDDSTTDTAFAKRAAYKTIFACYSHEDDSIVQAASQGYRALGINVLQDVRE